MDDYLKLPNIDFKFRSEDGKVPLHYAVAFNNLTAVQKFLERDPSVINFQDNTGATPLHFAAKNDNLEIAKLLLEKGASKDIRITKDDFEGQLPVDLAKSDEMKALLATTTAPPVVAPMWKGYTKTDADLFNEMFTKPNDWSFCPVCLS